MVKGYVPETLAEALALRRDKAVIPYGGGTELMTRRPRGEFLFLHRIPELKQFRSDGNIFFIGSGCSFTDIVEAGNLPELIQQAAASVGSPAIRNLGTLGGNVCNASPAADMLPALYLYDAVVLLSSLDDRDRVVTRRAPVSAFILGVKKTGLASGELMTGIEFAKTEFSHSVFHKVGARKAQAISKASLAAALTGEGGRRAIRAAFGAVGPTVIRRPELELLAGEKSSAADIVALYEDVLTPIDDQRSTSRYRRRVCLNLLREFLISAGYPAR
jgi:CO/xanthine dehydrogenase FAD-binding subunit